MGVPVASGVAADAFENIYAEMNLEQLLAIQVESVAGVPQDWFKTPAAVYVIDAKEIMQSGHQHLAEVLRLVPGVHVGRINSHEWAVGIRGFNSQFSNKLQVLIDGREIYEPFFSGVQWKNHDLVLADIDQIEVIRGPGATLWGANAVNGVVNVETKSAKQTQGFYLKEVLGTEMQNITAMRYGGQSGEDTYYRLWGKYTRRDSFDEGPVWGGFDAWDMGYAGIRIDHDGSDHTDLMVQGKAIYSDGIEDRIYSPSATPFLLEVVDGRTRAKGAHVLGRLKHKGPDGEGWTASAYVDYLETELIHGNVGETFTANVDWRQIFDAGERHSLLWGTQYRLIMYEVESSLNTQFHPGADQLHLFSGFIQDTMTLKPDRWYFMVGSKFEHNPYTGFEIQPSGRLWWTPDDHQTLWASISRAVRRPAPSDRAVDVAILRTHDDEIQLMGNPEFVSEELIAYEAGYRIRPNGELTVDTTVFVNRYGSLATYGSVGGDLMWTNEGRAKAYGWETLVAWKPDTSVEISGSYSLLLLDAYNMGGTIYEDGEPTHQFQLRGNLGIADDLVLHGALYYVDDVYRTPHYWRMDLGMTWHVSDNMDIAIWGQNLLDDSHEEFVGSIAGTAEVEHAAYLEMRIRF